jgi:hypothetical protein
MAHRNAGHAAKEPARSVGQLRRQRSSNDWRESSPQGSFMTGAVPCM